MIRANPSLRFNTESIVQNDLSQSAQEINLNLSDSKFKLNQSSLMSSTYSGVPAIRDSIREIEVIEEDDEDIEQGNELEIVAEEHDEVDAKTVVSEIERKFRTICMTNIGAQHLSRIIEDESAESIIVKGDTYKKLYNVIGGFCIFFLANLAIISQTISGLATSYFI